MDQTSPHTYCHNHPTVETALRCNKCGEYICPKCAVHTPTGYSCKTCIKSQQKVYDNSNPMDAVLAVVVAAVLSFIGSLLVGVLGYFFLIFLAPLAGIVIGEAVRLVTKKRRSQKVFRMVLIAIIVGALPLFVFNLILMLLSLGEGVEGLWLIINVLKYGYYMAITATTANYRVSGQTIRFRR